MVNQDRLINRFCKLVGIASVSGREGAMRDLLIKEMAGRGLTAQEDEAAGVVGGESGNLLVSIAGNVPGRKLLFAAHMDTVEPGEGITAVLEKGIIRSQGDTILGADDKAAIAALLEALDVINENRLPHPDLELLFTVGEEQGLKGAKAFDFRQLRAEIGYVLDAGGEPGSIVIQSPCQNEIEYEVFGRAAHAGINPEEGLNAIHVAAQALAKMPCGRIDAETTCNFGLIQGGQARNIVAEYCRVKGEARSLSRSKLDQLTARLVDCFSAEVQARGGRANTNVTFLYPEICLQPGDEVVRLAVAAAQRAGMKSRLIKTGGGSDASIIHGAGIPCANLGVGMRQVHTCEEFIQVSDLLAVTKLILAIIDTATE
ncbi:MAG: M20/M25/M40 family metallo-hydrolase [Syntrophomonadaceae bacterium]|jgi:tripeptide aminopeptidase